MGYKPEDCATQKSFKPLYQEVGDSIGQVLARLPMTGRLGSYKAYLRGESGCLSERSTRGMMEVLS